MTTNTTTPVTSNESIFEHSFSYRNEHAQLVQIALTHVPGVTPSFSVASFETEDNPNMDPCQLVQMGLDKARALRDLLTNPAVSAYLDAE
jgi:hypothetical protein